MFKFENSEIFFFVFYLYCRVIRRLIVDEIDESILSKVKIMIVNVNNYYYLNKCDIILGLYLGF